jgi:hypothetical protein
MPLGRASGFPFTRGLADHFARRGLVDALDRALDDGGHVGRHGDGHGLDRGHPDTPYDVNTKSDL